MYYTGNVFSNRVSDFLFKSESINCDKKQSMKAEIEFTFSIRSYLRLDM